MEEKEDFSHGYIKGFKEGLIEAWNELMKLTGRGYTSRELQIMVKSARTALMQRVEQKMTEIEKALGRKIFIEESELKSGVSISDISPGMSICFKEEHPKKGLSYVKSLMEEGLNVLSISRKHPDIIRDKFGVKGKMIWLTKSEQTSADENSEFISPTSLPLLAESIQEFLDLNLGGIIFVEGLEYLCTQNDYKSVLKFIQLINEQVLLKKGYLVISANPDTMDTREFSLIEMEMAQVA